MKFIFDGTQEELVRLKAEGLVFETEQLDLEGLDTWSDTETTVEIKDLDQLLLISKILDGEIHLESALDENHLPVIHTPDA